MISWMPTVGGILTGFGLLLSQIPGHPNVSLAGLIIAAAGAAFTGATSKQWNVHGGTVAQATPIAVQEQMTVEGAVLDAKTEVDKLKAQSPMFKP